VTGTQGLKRATLTLHDLHLASGAPLAADSGNPMYATLETYFEGVQLASSQTSLGSLTFMVPRDYDATVDKLRVRFLANSAGDTNTPTIDATLYRKRSGAALSADLDPTISAAVNSNTNKAGWVEIKAESLDLEPGDAVTFLFTTSAHTTDALNVYALEVVYFGDLAYYEEDERNDWE
jgi:plastocyanin